MISVFRQRDLCPKTQNRWRSWIELHSNQCWLILRGLIKTSNRLIWYGLIISIQPCIEAKIAAHPTASPVKPIITKCLTLAPAKNNIEKVIPIKIIPKFLDLAEAVISHRDANECKRNQYFPACNIFFFLQVFC